MYICKWASLFCVRTRKKWGKEGIYNCNSSLREEWNKEEIFIYNFSLRQFLNPATFFLAPIGTRKELSTLRQLEQGTN